MKVLVSDPLAKEAVDEMKEAGLEVVVRTGLSAEELKKIIPEFDALAVRSGTKVTKEIIEAAARLKLIVRAGVGLDNIDCEAAARKNIRVENTPFATSTSVAEHTLALMLALVRRIPQARASLCNGEWDRKRFQGTELRGKTLAVIGLGRIGQEVAKRGKCFGMTVVANDRLADLEIMEALEIEHVPSLFDVMAAADIVTVHVPLNEETRYLFDMNLMRKMKKGALLVNAARGGIVDERALYTLLKEGHLGGAALDVFEEEPPPKDHPLLSLPNVIAVPHLGASTAEGQQRAGSETARILIAFAHG